MDIELNNSQIDDSQNQVQLDDTLAAQRETWTNEIAELNEKMKTVPKLDELLNSVYIKRQKAVDFYYAMNGIIIKNTKEYKKLYNDMFNAIKVNGFNGIRFSSDQAITRQIECELQDRKEIIDLLMNHNNFIKETIQTIDNIIYGINQKVKITELINGIKF